MDDDIRVKMMKDDMTELMISVRMIQGQLDAVGVVDKEVDSRGEEMSSKHNDL